jgi:hypothetical protein
MTLPKLGMTYEQTKRQLKRLWPDEKLRKSLLNQCKKAEGEGAARELVREFTATGTSGSMFCGFGEGKKFGTGTWIFQDGRWVSAYSPL